LRRWTTFSSARQDVAAAGTVPRAVPDALGTARRSFVYALGTVTARFPSLSIEKEFLQAWGKNPSQILNISDADKFEVLSQGQNLYLAREMCWVFQSGDIDTYILSPRSYVELTDLVTCLSPTPNQISHALVIGTLGPPAPPEVCNGLQLPVVACSQVFSFTGQAFVNSIAAEVKGDPGLLNDITGFVNSLPPGPVPTTVDSWITGAATTAFGVLSLLSDNLGQTDEHRAVNYLTFKSMTLYKKEIVMEMQGLRLNSVSIRPDALAGDRSIQDVILLYASTTTTEVQRYFTRVDVTGQFPFLLNDLAPFYDHP
jgi:hypothetical protein